MLVYSNCEQVELLLNGKSLGTQNRPPDDSPRSWRVQFEPGELKAIGRNKGLLVKPKQAYASWVFARLAPGLLQRMSIRFIADQRKRQAANAAVERSA